MEQERNQSALQICLNHHLSNSLLLLQMYKHTYMQRFKLCSGEYKAGHQLTYSNLLADQSVVDVFDIFTAKGSASPR